MSYKALGLWNMGDDRFHPILDPRKSKDIIKYALKSKIAYFDTAFSYKNADTYLSAAIRETSTDRRDINIISKVMPVPTLEKKVEASLKRLNTSYIDYLLLHWPTEEKMLFSSLKTLQSLKERGICKEIGVSNFPLKMLEKTISDFPITVHERPLSLFWIKDFDKEKQLGLKTFAYAPFGMGILDKTPCDMRKDLFFFNIDETKAIIEETRKLATSYNATIYDIAYSYTLKKNPFLIISGASKPSQLNIKSIDLTEIEMQKLNNKAKALDEKALSDNIFSHNYMPY